MGTGTGIAIGTITAAGGTTVTGGTTTITDAIAQVYLRSNYFTACQTERNANEDTCCFFVRDRHRSRVDVGFPGHAGSAARSGGSWRHRDHSGGRWLWTGLASRAIWRLSSDV